MASPLLLVVVMASVRPCRGEICTVVTSVGYNPTIPTRRTTFMSLGCLALTLSSAKATATRHLVCRDAASPQPLSARNSTNAKGASPALTTRYAYTFSVAGPHHPSVNDFWHKVMGATGRHGKAAPPPTEQPHPLLYATPLTGVSRPTTGSDEPHPASLCRRRCRSNLSTADRQNTSPRVRPSTRDATVPGGDSFLIECSANEEECASTAAKEGVKEHPYMLIFVHAASFQWRGRTGTCACTCSCSRVYPVRYVF